MPCVYSVLMPRRVLVIITGSIAAYKALELIRLLRREGTEVTALLTAGGAEFITKLAVSSLTGTATYGDLFSLTDEVEMGHIRLSREHDVMVIAPASADFLAKMAGGRADDLAGAVVLAGNIPILAAPAMNHRMWTHPATRRNVAQLRADGVEIIAPASGDLACGEEGEGRMAEPEVILAAIRKKLSADAPLAGKRALVTSGPTQEPIDPVRYIGNRSSGRQGHAVARALARAGAEVTLISGPAGEPAPAGVKLVPVVTAAEMYAATMAALPVDIAVCAAAVADWTPANPAPGKLKKRQNGGVPEMSLTPTQDILAALSRHPTNRPALVVGFAAETESLLSHAAKKREAKGCDWLLACDVSGGKVFDAEATQLLLVTAEGCEAWPAMSKRDAAERLVGKMMEHASLKLPEIVTQSS